jgi:F-type H+-transporting ATPase subunit delta
MQTARQARRTASRLFRLCLVDGSVDGGRAQQIVRQVIDGGGTGGLSVLSRFARLVRLERQARSARVASAVPLAPDLRARIDASLTRRYGAGLVTSFEEDAGLIGGVCVTVGSDVYDGSLKGGLAALEARFR